MKNLKKLLFALGTASILVPGGAMTALAETNIAAESDFVYTPIRVYGTAQKLTDGRLHLTNSSTDSINDIVVTTQNSLILDAVSGMPVSYEDIQETASKRLFRLRLRRSCYGVKPSSNRECGHRISQYSGRLQGSFLRYRKIPGYARRRFRYPDC